MKIAGIGDLANDINVITPEMDAEFNNFVLGGNAITSGLTVQGSTLKKGTCVLLGIRGELETDIAIDTTKTYIYGKFILASSGTDSFDIVFDNTQYSAPLSISRPNTYYLKLYEKVGASYVLNNDLLTDYPKQAHHSDEAVDLVAGGTIAENVTGVTQATNDYSTKIATTEYVKNQIEYEIAAANTTVSIDKTQGNSIIRTSFDVYRRAKYVIGMSAVITFLRINPAYPITEVIGTMPEGYRPKTEQRALLLVEYSESLPVVGDIVLRDIDLTIRPNGEIVPYRPINWVYPSEGVADISNYNTYIVLGYETN